MPILLAVLTMAASPGCAQDIVGLEDCAKATSPDKKIGCLQSNVAYLHGLIRKAETAAQARAREDAARLAAATARIDALAAALAGLADRLGRLEKPPAKK
jgi:septal ring factor EnvC (AmiA/AmiB activator)